MSLISMRRLFSEYRLAFFHLIFWVVLISYRLFDFTQYLSMNMALIFFGIPTAFNMIVSYIHYFFLWRYVYKQKKWLTYLSLLTILLASFVGLRFLSDNHFVLPLSPDRAYYQTIHLARVISVLWGYLSFMTLTIMIKVAVDWYELENKRKQLENEKLNAELNYLKSQINPHFLFNTLHNLNYLTQSKDDAASDVIIRLSNIMRYMIYETNKEEVAISEELQYMKDYIELEKIRLNQSFDISFEVGDGLEDCKIAPLLLFTCLENAFKHGVSDKQKSWIKITLSNVEGTIAYSVSNSKITQPSLSEPSGFGLQNLRKRLALHYPDNHSLKVDETHDSVFDSLKNPQHPMKCVVIDDEPLARKLLGDYIEKVPYLELKGSFSSALEALEMINSQDVDLLFLDIQMPDINGVDFLKSLQHKPSVIFTTAHVEYAFEGYQLDVLDYLLKPFDFAAFLRSVEKVKNLRPLQQTSSVEIEYPFMFLKQGNELIKVQVADIYYIKGLKDYLRVITKQGQYIVLKTMKSMLENLAEHQFIRIHNSYIISIKHIESIQGTKLKIAGETLPVGGTYKKHLYESISHLIDESKI